MDLNSKKREPSGEGLTRPTRGHFFVWCVYAALAAFIVAISPAYSMLEKSFLEAAWIVLFAFAAETISPPIHLLGLPLIVIGVLFANRRWGICAGIIGILLWAFTGLIMSGLLVT